MKPESFPFLRISKKYDISYYDLLGCLSIRYPDGFILRLDYLDIPIELKRDIMRDIALAIEVQQKIRNREIDWITGETIQQGTPAASG